jgi:hypothetical protein
MRLLWLRMPKTIWEGSKSKVVNVNDRVYHVIYYGPLRHPVVCTT